MKVLMINVCCGSGSTGRICTDLATSLEKKGHIVKIAYGRDSVSSEFERFAIKIGSNQNIKLHGLKARLFDASGWGSKNDTLKFVSWIKQFDPDVIHLHNVHGYYINIEVLFNYLKESKKRIIWTLHDCWPFTGHAAYCDAANCERWITGCFDCPNIREYPKSFIDNSKNNWLNKKNLFDGFSNLTIVTPSIWLAKLVEKSYLSQYPVRVIHNGIDISKFYPLENDFRSYYGVDRKYIVLGLLPQSCEYDEYHDIDRFTKLLGDDYQLVLYGFDDEITYGFSDSVIKIRSTKSYKELMLILSAADYIVDLSSDSTGLDNILYNIISKINTVTFFRGKSSEIGINNYNTFIKYTRLEELVNSIKNDKSVKKNNQSDSNVENGYWHEKNNINIIGNRVILGVASVWDKRKGLDDIEKLSKKLDDSIIVVGVTNRQIKKLPSNIISYTRTNSVDELRRIYSLADVFINPTYEDNFPTTNIEALCCGTPVVSYRTGGSPESATCVIDKGCIEKLDCNEFFFIEECEEMGKSFCKESMIDNYMKLYCDNQ